MPSWEPAIACESPMHEQRVFGTSILLTASIVPVLTAVELLAQLCLNRGVLFMETYPFL